MTPKHFMSLIREEKIQKLGSKIDTKNFVQIEYERPGTKKERRERIR